MIRWLSNLITGGLLNRVLDTIDSRVVADTDREALKAEVIKQHYATRADFMRAGGFWLMLIFAAPLAAWWTAVLVYSVLWCHGCAFPQPWSVAALPAPLDDWAGAIVLAIFGVIGLDRFKK